jgi:calcium permeable stress-gated cation channel
MVIIIFFVFTVVTWPILLPVDAADVKGSTQEGLDKLSWGNITPSLDDRLAAHIVIIYLLTFFVFYMIRREMLHFVHMRHQYLISKSHSRQARARTVLVTSIPEEFGEERNLRDFASFVPGGVERVWIYRDTETLNQKFEERQKACARLEKACSKLLRNATKSWDHRQTVHTKEVKQLQKLQRKGKGEGDIEKLNLPQSAFDPDPLQPQEASIDFLKDLVPENQWPKHRIGKLHVIGIGKKVNTIEYCKVTVHESLINYDGS